LAVGDARPGGTLGERRRAGSRRQTPRQHSSTRMQTRARRPITPGMADREQPPTARRSGRLARVDRHRIGMPASEPVAPAEPALPVAPSAPAAAPLAPPAPVPKPPAPRPRRPEHPVLPVPAARDLTPGAVRRPAHISDHCLGCGAPTTGRSGMVTELVEVGPVRALRVVACSACSGRRRLLSD
jgi:hypothetical protein